MKRCSGVKASHGGAKHGVGTKVGLVRCTIQFNHHFVNDALLVNGQANKRFFQVIFDIVHGLRDTFSEVNIGVAVSQLKGFVSAS